MPPPLDWKPYEEELKHLYTVENLTIDAVMEHIKQKYHPAGFRPSKRALERQLRRWNVKKPPPIYADDRLIDKVKELYNRNLGHEEILRILTDVEGFKISGQQLKRLRLHPKLRLIYRQSRRVPGVYHIDKKRT